MVVEAAVRVQREPSGRLRGGAGRVLEAGLPKACQYPPVGSDLVEGKEG